MNYSGSCVGSTWVSTDIRISANQGIRISRDVNNRFFIWIQNHGWNNDYTDTWYLWLFEVFKDNQWFYTQNTGSGFYPRFTREIRVQYLDPTGAIGNSNDDRMEVKAIVQWQEAGSSDIKKVEMDTLLSNWKN